jgi:chromosome segregation ATPase
MRWTLLLVACAHAPTVTPTQLARLPEQSRQEIAQARGSIEAADQNLTAAKTALDEARRFQEISERELDAARIRDQAAQSSVELSQRSGDERSLKAARVDREAAIRELLAARAKRDYSMELVDLRRAELDQRRAELTQANAAFEYLKFRHLYAYGLAGDLREGDFLETQDRAADAVARERTRVARLRGNAEAVRSDWLLRAREHRTASSAMPAPRSMDFPPPSQPPAGPASEAPPSD